MARALPNKAIEEFIAIYEQEFDKRLDQETGKVKAEKVYSFFKTLIESDRKFINLSGKGVHINGQKKFTT